MKIASILFSLLFCFAITSHSQSNPHVLKSGISIQRLMTVHNGAIRVERDPVSGNLFYVLTSGEVYEVIIPDTGTVRDTLLFTTANHTVSYVQGMVFHDSTLYISGNNHSDSLLTIGIVARGKLNSGGMRVWDTLMITQYYKTADYFDHLFSGVTVSPAGDTLYICSGARGDHGEIQTRYGAYPNLRNVPLTTNIFSIPTNNPAAIVLQNDSLWLASSGYLFSRGVRNHFDMAFDGSGHLFAVENSGDRDHNEEMNWLQRGHHYGFPWKMGDTDNPQQFPGFVPANDKLISHYSRAWRNHFWTNDPAFPVPPPGIVFDAPIQNFGPDCDKFRDTSGYVHDASDSGISIGTFTAHRSPLGLVFDRSNILGPLYQGDGFMLSWTKGLDSCGCTSIPDTGVGPFVDPSQDLVHLDLAFDSAVGNFRLNAEQLITDFQHPVDAAIDSNKIFVIENGYGSTSGLFEIHLPVADLPCTRSLISVCDTNLSRIVVFPYGAFPTTYSYYDTSGTLIQSDTLNDVNGKYIYLPSGNYYAVTSENGACPLMDSIPFSIADTLTLLIDSVYDLSQGSGMLGEIFSRIEGGTAPFQWTLSSPSQSYNEGHIDSIPAGNYILCVTDSNFCLVCDSVFIIDPFVGLKNPEINNSFSLFPNPVNEKLNLVINKTSKVDVAIFDTQGRQALHPVMNAIINSGDNNVIDCSALTDGIYSVQISIDGKITHRKIIIN